MGRYGQAILTIVGTVVGAYFGYPALGAALGSLVGGFLFPPQLPTVSGPRLSDITNTAASVGAAIPRGWGTFPAAGCIIWQSDVREVIEKEEVGGKGSSSQTVETPTYYQDFAIGLNDGVIQGIRRVWANGKIVADRKVPENYDPDVMYADLVQQLLQSQVAFDSIEIYLGTEDQLPSPTLEAALGVGNVSAFRGLAYIVFVNWRCKPEDGNRIPAQWKFECYTDGIESDEVLDIYSNEVLYPWDGGDLPLNDKNVHTFQAYRTGQSGVPVSGSYSSLNDAISEIETAMGQTYDFQNGYSIKDPASIQDIFNVLVDGPRVSSIRLDDYDLVDIFVAFNHISADRYQASLPSVLDGCSSIPLEGATWCSIAQASHNTEGTVWVRLDLPDLTVPPGYNTNVSCGGDPKLVGAFDCAIRVNREPRAPDDSFPCYAAISTTTAYCVDAYGNVIPAGPWIYDDTTTYKVLSQYATAPSSVLFSGDVVTSYPLNPARPLGHTQYNDQDFWEEAYVDAVARGLMPAGLTYGVDYPKTQGWGYKKSATGATVVTNKVPVWQIIRDISVEAGMTDSDLNFDDIDDLLVVGYVRTRVMTARAAIDPLRSFGFFDGYESDGKIRYVKRGGAISATFTNDDLGAHVVGDEAPSKLTTRKIQDFELPRQVRVHYLSLSRDYEPGQQDSLPRIDTASVNDLDIELPIVLEDEEAAKIASVLWSDYWASRWVHEIVVDAKWHALEPTDVVQVPVDENYERMRITATTDTLPNLRKFELQRDDDGAYISYAVAESPPLSTPPLKMLSPVEVVFLDLPALRDEDDNAGFYVAARPVIAAGLFPAAAIMRSADSGSNFSTVSNVDSTTPMGFLVGDTAEGPTTIWDELTTIKVDMVAGALESRTRDAVLAGANAAAIGGHGYWEVVQFRNVAQISETIWEISGLLRGRRGTEHNVGLSTDGDRFVMLSAGTLTRVGLDLALVNKPMLYKAVTAGLPIDSATMQEFTGAGEALKPFSPGFITGERDTEGNLRISWIRRGRIGQTLAPGTDVPLSEEREDYEVEILDDAGEARRTISTLTPSAVYTATQQMVDFGALQEVVVVRIYQISAAVGRGHFSEDVL